MSRAVRSVIRVKIQSCFCTDETTGLWMVKVAVYYEAWSGHEGGDLQVFVEGAFIHRDLQFSCVLC